MGASWEGFVVEQILGVLNATGTSIDPWFFRSADGQEIDLIFQWRQKLWAVEVKLTTHPTPQDLHGLNRVADLVGADKRVLVSQTTRSAVGKDQISCALPELLKILMKPGQP